MAEEVAIFQSRLLQLTLQDTSRLERALSALASKLVAGASITVAGYVRANAPLARRRVASVVAFLATKEKVEVTRKTYARGAANKITLVTTKQ